MTASKFAAQLTAQIGEEYARILLDGLAAPAGPDPGRSPHGGG